MPDAQTIFYSWQSDRKQENNRFFIRDALKIAIKTLKRDSQAMLEQASRPERNGNAEIELDHDTKDEPGTPPIFDTILKKISKATAFVADITFVGTSDARSDDATARPLPNPNVLIEFGFALKALSMSRIIVGDL